MLSLPGSGIQDLPLSFYNNVARMRPSLTTFKAAAARTSYPQPRARKAMIPSHAGTKAPRAIQPAGEALIV